MREICRECKYYESLPFSNEFICTNGNSDYADCECKFDDTCEEWVSREEEDE